jgi:replicative DNA helicase
MKIGITMLTLRTLEVRQLATSQNSLQDKKAIMHVFAGLMAEPELMGMSKQYNLKVEDFPEKFHKLIFGAIFNLYQQGISEISPQVIDGYLSAFALQYKIYEDNSGLDYLFKVEELGMPSNFDYYYNRIKKYSFLRACISQGINVSDIFDTTMVDIKDSEKQQEVFDEMTLEDMVKRIEDRVMDIKGDFLFDSENNGSQMAEGLREAIAEKKLKPTYGNQLASSYYTAVTRGALPRKLMLISGNSGSGKSRFALANILTICVPEIYDSKKGQWVKTGATGRGAFISTELEDMEIKIPSLCFIADIDEDKIHRALLTEEEQIRLDRAIEILEITPVWFEELHDFDLDDIEHVIEKNVRKNGVTHVAHDYIHTSMKMFSSMAKAGARNLQEHQILLQMSIKLKEIANKHNIWLTTSTQLNNSYKDEENNMDDSALSGAKAIAQKVDFGALMLPVSTKDEDVIEAVMSGTGGSGQFGMYPTHSINVYKSRGGRWKRIRIWINFNLSNLRCTDLFVTDYKGVLIPNIKPLHIVYETKEEQISDLPASFDF